MIRPRTQASSVVLGALLTIAISIPAGQAEEYVSVGTLQTGTLQTVASRCADFGPGFIDMGNGICGRVGSTSRVQLGTRSASSTTWTSNGTTSAAMRSDGMLPGAAVQHLRVRGFGSNGQFQ